MIKFLLKGLIRDRSRSLFPVMITASGVAITVLALAWVGGVMNDTIETSASFEAGHVKVMTLALHNRQHPDIMELALTGTNSWQQILEMDYPEFLWICRVKFGGLLDIPGDNGETISQAPVAGISIDLLSGNSTEIDRLGLGKSLIKGRLPQKQGEMLISDSLFEKLALKIGQKASLISSDMNGSMTVASYTIAGTLTFGIKALDRGAMITDIADTRMALNMMDATTEILGFFKEGFYIHEKARQAAIEFNKKHSDKEDPFAPIMVSFKDQGEFGQLVDYTKSILSAIIIIFVFIISIVLWNAGLMNGIRRYGEIGVRLAIGESKSHLFLSLIMESVLVGVSGYILGTMLGLLPAYYLQIRGVDISLMTQNSSLMMSNVMRAKVIPLNYWIGIIPGVVAPVIGAMISGAGIYKRDISRLFKELEV